MFIKYTDTHHLFYCQFDSVIVIPCDKEAYPHNIFLISLQKGYVVGTH